MQSPLKEIHVCYPFLFQLLSYAQDESFWKEVKLQGYLVKSYGKVWKALSQEMHM